MSTPSLPPATRRATRRGSPSGDFGAWTSTVTCTNRCWWRTDWAARRSPRRRLPGVNAVSSRTFGRSGTRKDRPRYPDVDLFLLRNLTRGSGIGFFGSQGFYPDFILWLKTGGRQHIVFVEPHGMLHANAWERDEKARLHERLRDEVGPAVERRSGTAGVTLDSYIVSATPFDDLSRRYGEGNWTTDRFADKHILFFPESRPAKAWPYLRRILDDQLRRGGPPAPRTSPEGGTSE